MSAKLPPGSRTLKSLAVVLTGPEYNDDVIDFEFNEGPPHDLLLLRCRGDYCPPSVSKEIARSRFGLRTMDKVTTDSTVVHVFDPEDVNDE